MYLKIGDKTWSGKFYGFLSYFRDLFCTSTAVQSTTVQSTTVQSTTVQSTTVQSTTVQSTTVQSTNVQITTVQSTNVQSTIVQIISSKLNFSFVKLQAQVNIMIIILLCRYSVSRLPLLRNTFIILSFPQGG